MFFQFESVESHRSSIQMSKQKYCYMLSNMNVILYEYFYRRHLLIQAYKHLIYRCYLARQFALWYYRKLQKKSLGFNVIVIGIYSSVTSDTKRNAFFKLNKILKRVSDSIGNIKVYFRYFQWKYFKAEQKHCLLFIFQIQVTVICFIFGPPGLAGRVL